MEKVVRVSAPKAAEMAKLLENTFRHINIALVNELAILCQDLDVDVWEVIDAAASKPFGFMPFYPGPGVGGHCIPVDPMYLSWRVKQFGGAAKFIDLARDVNAGMPLYVVQRVQDLLNDARALAEGRPHPHPRGGLQAQHQRHARVTRAPARSSCCARRGRPSPTPIRTCRC